MTGLYTLLLLKGTSKAVTRQAYTTLIEAHTKAVEKAKQHGCRVIVLRVVEECNGKA